MSDTPPSKVFFSNNGMFSIVFNGATIEKETYQPQVGTYISLIIQNCAQPIISLVATHLDLVKKSSPSLSFVYDFARQQINHWLKEQDMESSTKQIDLCD